MSETFIHVQQHDATSQTADNRLARMRELLPNGDGYVRVLPDGTIVLDTPSGGGSGGGGGGGGGVEAPFREKLTVLAANTLSALTFTPTPSLIRNLCLEINGVRFSIAPNMFTYNAATKTIDLSPTNDYSVQVGWDVWAEYYTDENIAPPVITGLSPSSVTVGDTLTITGENFTPSIVLTVGGISHFPFTFVNAQTLQITITPQLYSGTQITAQNPLGIALSNDFVFVPPVPTITAFSPVSQSSGLNVTITGTNFYNVSAVSFGGLPAMAFTVNSITEIVATLGSGNSGHIQVTTMYGTATISGFTYIDVLSGSNLFCSDHHIVLPIPDTNRVYSIVTNTVLPENFTSLAAINTSARFITPIYVPLMNRWFSCLNGNAAIRGNLVIYSESGGVFTLLHNIASTTLAPSGVQYRRVVHVGGAKIALSTTKASMTVSAQIRFATYNVTTNVFTPGNLFHAGAGVLDMHYHNGFLWVCLLTGTAFQLRKIDAINETVVETRNVLSSNELGAIVFGDNYVLLYDQTFNRVIIHHLTSGVNTQITGIPTANINRRFAYSAGFFWIMNNNGTQLLRIDPVMATATTVTFGALDSSTHNGIMPSADGQSFFVFKSGGNRIVQINGVTQSVMQSNNSSLITAVCGL